MVPSVRSGATHWQAAFAQHAERLRRGHFVDQVQVDEQHRRRVGGLGHDLVPFPDFLEKRLRLQSSADLRSGGGGARRAAMSTGSSQPYLSGVAPVNRPKNAFCSFSVTGPRRPLPTVMRSTERMGVISAAVPVKNSSSAMYSISRGIEDLAHFEAHVARQRDHRVARDAAQHRMREARRVDHAIAHHEQVLAGAFADGAIRRQADALDEAQALGFHADQLAGKIVAARPWPWRAGCSARRAATTRRRRPRPRPRCRRRGTCPIPRRPRPHRRADRSSAPRRSRRSRGTRPGAGRRHSSGH